MRPPGRIFFCTNGAENARPGLRRGPNGFQFAPDLMKTDRPLECRGRWVVRLTWPGCAAPLAALLLAACNTGTTVKIDSTAKPKAEEAISYQFHSKDPDVPEDSLRYKEATGYVKTALSGKGMYEAPRADLADIVVDVEYGVSPPVTKMEIQEEPVYITLPGQFHTESVFVGTDRNGNAIYRTVTVQDPPHEEFAGYREHPVAVTTYEKYLRMNARSSKPAQEGQPTPDVWAVDISTEGESKDLRKALPVLAAASIDYVGKDSGGPQVIHLKDKDPDVTFVKKGMPPDSAAASSTSAPAPASPAATPAPAPASGSGNN